MQEKVVITTNLLFYTPISIVFTVYLKTYYQTQEVFVCSYLTLYFIMLKNGY